MIFRYSIHLTLIALFLISCSNVDRKENYSSSHFTKHNVDHAHCFSISVGEENLIELKTFLPEQSSNPIQTVRINDHTNSRKQGITYLEDVDNVVVVSTTYLPFLEALDELTSISGLSNTKLVYSENVRKKVEEGEIADIGGDHNLNFERIIELNPDFVLMYDFGTSTSSVQSRLESLGVNVLLISEYRELSPLGKAEWIKFFGALFNKLEESDQIFTEIEKEYLSLLDLKYNDKPTVFTGLPWKGQWYQPGGKSFQAQFFEDAGADYLWKEDENTSGIQIDREVVLDVALNADFWMHPSNSIQLSEITDQDSRYGDFQSYKTGMVYNNNLRLNNNMGNDYWESAILKPHLVLKDLISIFHPELMPDHQLYYYRHLGDQ